MFSILAAPINGGVCNKRAQDEIQESESNKALIGLIHKEKYINISEYELVK